MRSETSMQELAAACSAGRPGRRPGVLPVRKQRIAMHILYTNYIKLKHTKNLGIMKKGLFIIMVVAGMLLAGCGPEKKEKEEAMGIIPRGTVDLVVSQLSDQYGANQRDRIERGVSQVASFWMESDGGLEEFRNFCLENYQGEAAKRHSLFEKLSFNYEKIWGHFNQMSLELNKALHLDVGPIEAVDVLFGGFSPAAHLTDDFFSNGIAFLTILNFPFYSLEEKAAMAGTWNRRDWAYARMGDIYSSRVPARVNQEASRISTASDNYISEYNIVMGNLLDDDGARLFPDNMRLITHWGLRDEIKSNYGLADGLPKQQMIHRVMERIIRQDIPQGVINNAEVDWNPFTNEVRRNGEAVDNSPEPDTRYVHLLNNFHARRAADPYSPSYPTAIQRAFNQGLELTQPEVEALFKELVGSPVLKDVGALISERLGRPLEPFDIWYDGFKARSAISEEELDRIVGSRYPDREAFENDLPEILVKLGWQRDRAREIASKIVVEASRGAGHAWGATMRSQYSHLRTRINPDGMDYKGYNIAVHEYGHNVEQTISLHDVDYYMMNGVPNTAFTEALAFIFQSRDLELLGISETDPMAESLNALDKLWGTYEIMGVSLVDMEVWKWMYENPDATPARLKEQTIAIAIDVWNAYYAPVFGVEDSPILAIYSHMISYPLYLSAYPLGRLIEFQLERQIRGKNLAEEADRVFSLGRLIPQQWMHEAVGEPLSARPMIDAAAEAVNALK